MTSVPKRTILVTGGSGQLATALGACAPERVHVVGRPVFDFDRPDTLDRCLQVFEPSAVINAAAWTAVDLAETNEDAAFRANAEGPARLAQLCKAASIPLVHVSTDYVFDGNKGSPYTEDDATGPAGVYGRTKLAGERAVLDACSGAVVARTSWVFAATGKNFVRTMLTAAERARILRVVDDQYGCPTSAEDLARALLTIATRLELERPQDLSGVVHVAGTGSTTWHGLADAVFEAASHYGRLTPEVQPIKTAEWPTPAPRPPDSRLDCGRLAAVFGVVLPRWQDSVVAVVDALLSESARGARPALAD